MRKVTEIPFKNSIKFVNSRYVPTLTLPIRCGITLFRFNE